MHDIRKKAIWVGCGVIVATLLVVGGLRVIALRNPYGGLTLVRETQMPDATRDMLTQRIATTRAAIAARIDADEEIDSDLYGSLAYDSYTIGDLVTARETYEIILNNNPMYYVGWNAYANVLSAMGDDANAESAYRQALTLAPDVADYYLDLAMFIDARYADRDDEVRAILEQGVAVLGQKQQFMSALAEWYLAHGDCTRAIAHYKVVQTLNPAVAEQIDAKIAEARTACNE